jgi:hypothetical protein
MTGGNMDAKKVNLKQLQGYANECWQAQQKADGGVFPFPALPKFLNKVEVKVYAAYRNMARAWARQRGAVPDPTEYVQLLLTMVCNGIRFDRRPRSLTPSQKFNKQVQQEKK